MRGRSCRSPPISSTGFPSWRRSATSCWALRPLGPRRRRERLPGADDRRDDRPRLPAAPARRLGGRPLRAPLAREGAALGPRARSAGALPAASPGGAADPPDPPPAERPLRAGLGCVPGLVAHRAVADPVHPPARSGRAAAPGARPLFALDAPLGGADRQAGLLVARSTGLRPSARGDRGP